MTTELFATHEGELKIGDYTLRCAVLNNKQRVVFQREIIGLLTGNKNGGLDRYLRANNLQEYKPKKFINKTIDQTVSVFKAFNNKTAHGFEAPDIVDFLDMYLRARDAEALLPSQEHLATQAEQVIRSIAKVGIIALIDEATGYEKERIRVKDKLRTSLDRFIRQERFGEWTKRFPDDYYREIYRLNNWEWKVDQFNGKRYSVIGKWTTDIIYDRLRPEVLNELERLNPENGKGKRVAKHYKWLTDKLGHPELQAHFRTIMAMMRASDTWEEFMQQVNRAFPKFSDKLELFIDEN